MRRLFCVDPGSAVQAVVVLYEFSGVVSYASGALLSIADFHNALDQPYDAAILEIIEGYAYNQARVSNMVLTARNEGRIIEKLYGAFLTPQTCTAGEARGHFCRSAQASDAQVAAVVEDIVKGAPVALRKVDRQHLYDACLYGLFLLHRLGVRLTLSAAGDRALFEARTADHAKASAKCKRTKAAR